MIDITDKTYKPGIDEINDFIGNELFSELFGYLIKEYNAVYDILYSGDNNLPGWNIRFHKGGRTLCRLYPKKGFFYILIVIGKREKERTENLLPQLSEKMQSLYNSTREGMEQRWLIAELKNHDEFYDDLLKLIHIRRHS